MRYFPGMALVKPKSVTLRFWEILIEEVSSRLSTAPKLMRTPSTEGAGLGLSLFVNNFVKLPSQPVASPELLARRLRI